jgi:hypothetical protein
MRIPVAALVLCASVALSAQSPDSHLAEPRLSVHTLLREDMFAAWLENDMGRLVRAERNIEAMLKGDPIRQAQKSHLLAWRAGAEYFRAVAAHEAGKPDAVRMHLGQAAAATAQAIAANEGAGVAVHAIVGGTLLVLADRLPPEQRSTAWNTAYASYSELWKLQSSIVEKLPLHHQGELLGGMAETAYRTGRSEEAGQFADRMIALLQGSPYESAARDWKANPESRAITKLTCKSCHEPGRLASRLAAISTKQ